MDRHRLDVISLIFGVVFSAVSLVVLVDTWRVTQLWAPEMWPVALVLLGLWLLASAVRRSASSRQNTPGDTDGDQEPSTDPLAGP